MISSNSTNKNGLNQPVVLRDIAGNLNYFVHLVKFEQILRDTYSPLLYAWMVSKFCLSISLPERKPLSLINLQKTSI